VTPEVSAIVVNHRSAAHAVRCVETLRAAMDAEGVRGEIVLVDCASGEPDARLLASAAADRLLLLPENRGYSGGVNAGLARARGETLVLSNADVLFRSGSLRPLLDAAAGDHVGAAAPAVFWDGGDRIRLPAGYPASFGRDLLQILGRRLPGWERRFAAFARRSMRLWSDGGVTEHLSGAVLGVRRGVFDRIGRFDERFPFEHEETEWEDRLRAAGLRLRVAPASRVRHLWARSAAASDGAANRRAVSRALYRQRRYGTIGRALLERAERSQSPVRDARVDAPAAARRPGTLLALSPNASLLPFAAATLEEDFRLPRDLQDALPAGPIFLTTFRKTDGWPVATQVWIKDS
jgi:N-acetylglucosaminyl-diphospho-decaprenol L-rhamnosyltransferase